MKSENSNVQKSKRCTSKRVNVEIGTEKIRDERVEEIL